MEPKQHILIFKTNIATTVDCSKVAPILNQQPFIVKWTVDMEDVDCVLRVVATEQTISRVIALVNACEYECAELED